MPEDIGSRRLRTWARYPEFQRGERAMFAILALQAEQGVEDVRITQAELADMIGLDPDSTRQALKWLRAREIIEIDNSIRPIAISIQPEERWFRSETGGITPVTGDIHPGVNPPVTGYGYPVSDDHVGDHGSPMKPTNQQPTPQPEEVIQLARQEKPKGLSRKKRAREVEQEVVDERKQIINMLRLYLGRRHFEEIDRVHLRQITFAQRDGRSRQEIETALHGFIEARRKGGYPMADIDQEWLVGRALKDFDELKVDIPDAIPEILASRVNEPWTKIRRCPLCAEKIEGIDDEDVLIGLQDHYQYVHKGHPVPQV
jgi:hypothetical protein